VPPFLVRDATLDDLAAVRDVYRRSSLNNANDRANLRAHPELLTWSSDAISTGLTRVVSDVSGAVVGFATLKECAAGLELEDLFVDPDRMRSGIGTLLIADAVEQARRAGRGWIEVTANSHATAFYAAVGFKPVGVEETPFGTALRLRLAVSPRI
jgi:GNAT superfamily N-acetyltransferase